jgi:hypothetical protein
MKTCKHCNQIKPLNGFALQSGGKLGRRADCKLCVKRFIRSKRGLVKQIYHQQKRKSKLRSYLAPAYTEQDLYNWCVTRPNFNTMYEGWVSSNFATKCKPSVDRLNDFMSYTINNIQLITWDENNKKGYADASNGNNTKLCKAVDMFDKDWNFITRFYSASEAARCLGVSCPSNIIGACNNRVTWKKEKDGSKRKIVQQSSYGYNWKYSSKPNNNREVT